MDKVKVMSSINEVQEWIRRIKRGLAVERRLPDADPRVVDMLIESLEQELRTLMLLVGEK